MLSMLTHHTHNLKLLVNENSTTILTGVGAAGVAATAVLTGRATFKAARIIDEAALEVTHENNAGVKKEFTKVETVKLVWRHYVLPSVVGVGTISAIILAHKISAKRIAALTLAAGVSERTLKEYKEKVIEKFGENKATAVRDEIAQDRVNANPAHKELVAVGTSDVLCYDAYTGRYFLSTVENIKKAENEINYELLHFGSASLSEFFDKIGLSATSYSDLHGWNSNHLLEVTISTTKTPDDRPCIAVDFKNPPIADYSREPYN